MERTLAPVVTGLTGLGVSRPEVALLVSLSPDNFRCRPIVSMLQHCLPLFGSSENLFRVARHDASILSLSPKRTAKPNIMFLQECVLSSCDIAKLCGCVPRLLITNLERAREMVTLADGLGVPRGSRMFRHALQAIVLFSDKKMAATVDHLKRTLRWSDAEVRIALPKAPFVLRKPKESLQRRSELLVSEVGFERTYIAHRPVMLYYSIEGQLKPRYYVVKFLKENGLLKRNPSYFTIFKMGEKLFVEKYICPHKESAPHLAKDYAAACRGEVPSRLIF